MEKHIDIHYYALFRDARGTDAETVATVAASPRELYQELGLNATFCLDPGALKVALNDAFASWDALLRDGDLVVFIAPTSGG